MAVKNSKRATNGQMVLEDKNLGYLGTDFQYKLVKLFFEDYTFFPRVCPFVDPNMFTDDMLRRIVGFVKDRYAKNSASPNYIDIEMYIRKEVSDVITQESIIATLKKIKDLDLIGQDLVLDSADKFFKQQNLTKALNKAFNIIKDGNSERYYEIEHLINSALATNIFMDVAYNPLDDLELTLSEKARPVVPTGFDRLDKCLRGGLGRGELGVVIAPSNVGKTSAVTGFCAAAATTMCEDNHYEGYKVLHIHFEDDDYNIKRKYIGWITEIDAMFLSQRKDEIMSMLTDERKKKTEMIKKNIRCYHLMSGETPVDMIEQIIKRSITDGFKPDLVAIDYFECLEMVKGEKTDSEWTREGLTMRKLEAMAHRYNIAMWVPIQGTKDSFDKEILGLSSGGGSVKKIQIGHVVITLARTREQKINGRMTVSVEKLRAGALNDPVMANVIFNGGTGRFKCDQEDNDALDFIARSEEMEFEQDKLMAAQMTNRQARKTS